LETILELNDINFLRSDIPILSNISFQIHENESLAILGKNGSGKSTLINLIYGYLWPTTGQIRLFNKNYGEFPLRELQRKIGYLQPLIWEDRLQKNITIYDVILTGIDCSFGIYREYTKTELSQLEECLEENLSWIKNPYQIFFKCSSGERKKILLLRAKLANPDIYILDEPCSSLDLSSKYEFLNFAKKILDKKNLILVTHSVDEILPKINKTLLLKEGKILKWGDTDLILTSENLQNCYDIPLHLEKKKNTYSVQFEYD
jgi:iron complex transport system ATP-binding protein